MLVSFRPTRSGFRRDTASKGIRKREGLMCVSTCRAVRPERRINKGW
jgi:hypothetical protein